MRRKVTAVRIWPMSDKLEGFRGRSIEDVQALYFLGRLPARDGRFPYRSAGLNASPGTVVLFQFQVRIIATAVFIRDEKPARPTGHGGALCFEADSFQVFDPVDIDGMRKAWPRFRAFGHVKQVLNPGLYPAFKRRLKNVRLPSER